MSSLPLPAGQGLSFHCAPCCLCPPPLRSPPWLPSGAALHSDSVPCCLLGTGSAPLHTGAIAPVLSQLVGAGGEDTGGRALLCLTSSLCPQDCSAMHPWTSLAPAGPGAPQGSWWFDPAPPTSTVSATTPQVRERVEGGPSPGGGAGGGELGTCWR